MATQTRFVGSGAGPLVDAVIAIGAHPGDLRAAVWQATWSRGYDEVVAPAPAISLKEAGFVVLSRDLDGGRYATVIDTGMQLWALIAWGKAPALGSRVRVVPGFVNGEIGWNVSVVESLGLGLSIRFEQGGMPLSTQWIDRLRATLRRIRMTETQRRTAIDARRRTLTTLQPVVPFRDELHALHEDLRKRVDAETVPTAEERLEYERSGEKARRQIVADRNARRLARYKEDLETLRGRIPELLAQREKRLSANVDFRQSIQSMEDAVAHSRGVVDRSVIVEKQLDAIERAGLLVRPSAEADGSDPLDSAVIGEIARTVELLFDLIPRRAHKLVANG